MNMENFLLESFDLASIYDITTGELYALCDQIKDGSLENTVDSSDVTGKMGMLLASLDRNKAATITWNNAFLVAGLLAAQAGTDIEEASEDNKIQVPNFERVELDTDTTAKLSYVPVGVEGAEVKRIWLVASDGTQGAEYTVVADTPVKGKSFTVNAAEKTITFAADDLKKGSEIYVAYDHEITEGRKISNIADNFSKNARILVDCTVAEKCDENIKHHAILEIPKAKIDGNYTLDIGDEPAVHAFSAKTLTDVCAKDPLEHLSGSLSYLIHREAFEPPFLYRGVAKR